MFVIFTPSFGSRALSLSLFLFCLFIFLFLLCELHPQLLSWHCIIFSSLQNFNYIFIQCEMTILYFFLLFTLHPGWVGQWNNRKGQKKKKMYLWIMLFREYNVLSILWDSFLYRQYKLSQRKQKHSIMTMEGKCTICVQRKLLIKLWMSAKSMTANNCCLIWVCFFL